MKIKNHYIIRYSDQTLMTDGMLREYFPEENIEPQIFGGPYSICFLNEEEAQRFVELLKNKHPNETFEAVIFYKLIGGVNE